MRVYRFTIATAIATYFLILVGGLVNPTGSSLACPDWPLCYGSAFPAMKGGVLYEHSHRLFAFTVGWMSVALAILVRRAYPAKPSERPEHQRARQLATAAPFLVLAQAVLGGVTVMLKLPMIVTLTHLVNSMIILVLVITIAWHLRPVREVARTQRLNSDHSATEAISLRLRRWIYVAAGAVILQVLLGGIVRHTKSASACTDIPLCAGSLWPTELHPSTRIHMLHRIVGTLVAIIVIGVGIAVRRAIKKEQHQSTTRAVATILPILVIIQVGLGVLNVLLSLPLWTVTLHLGGAAALFALHVWLIHLTGPARVREKLAVQQTQTNQSDTRATAALETT